MKKYIPLLFLVLAFPAFARGHRHHQPPPVPIPPPVVQPPSTGITLGAFNANVGTVKVTFIAWNDNPPCFSGKTTFIYWENPNTTYDQIINGSQDSVIKNFAANVCPNTILSIFHEMNLNESPWFGPANKEIKAFQHVHNIIGNKVKYAWVVNDASIPNANAMSFYPGDAYVDIVGIDGFAWSNESFSQVIEPAYSQVKGINKPLWITSFGTGQNQASWITNAVSVAKADGIQGLLYFSYADQGGTNFTLTSQGLAAFHP